MEYLKVIWLPTPAGVGVTVGVRLAGHGTVGEKQRAIAGPTLVTNASGTPGEPVCSALEVVGKLFEEVSPVT